VIRSALSTAILVASVTFAAAQDAPPTLGGQEAPPPGWTSGCQSPAREAPLSCGMEQRAVLKETGQLVASLTIRVPGDTRKPVLLVRVPLGLSIEGGVTLDVDGKGGRTLPLQTCDNGGCYASTALPDDLLKMMQRGNQLDLIFQNLNKAPIKLVMSLTGFSDTYAKIQ